MNKRQFEENEDKKREEAFKQHKCYMCRWGKPLNKHTVVFCSRPLSCEREGK